jgi:hypothetical protein
MNEVYLIWCCGVGGDDVEGVFSTREKADEYLDAFKTKHLKQVVEDKVGRSFRSVQLDNGSYMMWDVHMVDYAVYE